VTPLAIVDRTEFDENLRQEAAKAGAKVLERKVTKINVKDNFVEVFTSFNGEEQLYTSEYLIAADGVHSIVRKQVRDEEISKWLTHYSDVESLVTTKCHIYFGSDLTDQAYAWRFPYGTGSDLGTAAPKNGKNYISNLFKFLGIDKESKVKGYHIPQWNTPIFYDQRVFYVGDAAEQVLPFTYEGIYYAMKSAKILSDVLIEEADCKEYERRWNNLYLKKFKVLDRLQKIF
jgi:geranylgeranyl reductase